LLVNEFGEMGIDNDLVVATRDQMVELSNGCICCSINGRLQESTATVVLAVSAILARSWANRKYNKG
jgi:G3E family GTPase